MEENSIEKALAEEDDVYRKFRRALRRSDQSALDDLFALAKGHSAAANLAGHGTRLEVLLLSMLLEQHKEIRRLQNQLEQLVPPESL